MKSKNLLVLLLSSFNIFSVVHESSSIKALHDHVYVEAKSDKAKKLDNNPEDKKSDTIVVALDLDNTTFKNKKEYAVGDSWFVASIEYLQKTHGLDSNSALDIVRAEYFPLQNMAEVEPVEKEIVDIIAKFQKDKIVVIGLTARSMPLEETTIRQLKSINIDFSVNCLAGNNEIIFKNLEHPCKYSNGILFVSENDKGKALTTYLDFLKHTPKKVIFADDKHKHAQRVDAACQAKNIESICIRYGFMDEEVKNYKLPEETKVKLSSKVKSKDKEVNSKSEAIA